MKNKMFWIAGIVLGVVIAGSFIVKNMSPCGWRGNARGYSAAEVADKKCSMLSLRREAVGGIADREVASAPIAAPAENVINAETGISRKLIKRAFLKMEVRSCDGTKKNIVRLVEKRSGIVLSAELDESVETAKSGQVIFKVLPAELDAVLEEVRRLGKVRSESVTTEDVTETYVDLATRLKSQKMVKERFVSILNSQAKQVKDIVSIEKELARVGTEIEALEGRLKYLNSQIDLSTVTVNFQEDRKSLFAGLDLGKKLREALRTAVEVFVNGIYAIIVLIALAIPFAIAALLIRWIVGVIKKIRKKR